MLSWLLILFFTVGGENGAGIATAGEFVEEHLCEKAGALAVVEYNITQRDQANWKRLDYMCTPVERY